MPYWLAKKRNGQISNYIQRFDPRFWTVNFPRPMMASVVTSAADALRVDAVFHHKDALAGLIWDSEDSLDHPLLKFATDRDYGHTELSFRWRSSGIKSLDAVHGPTLTIEGRDAAGSPRSWFVRLWNYASGSPEDAEIYIRFSHLDGGFLMPGEADPVHPADIDRMFISLVASNYDGTPDPLSSPQTAWMEMTDILCQGHRAMLEIGDIIVPPHGLSMATAYDDSFNQTPARLLRSVEALGYRGLLNHYVGMSHYFRLEAGGSDLLVAHSGDVLNAPCVRWHDNFVARAKTLGLEPIFSLSYELFNAHCPEDWKQRAENGDPALTGWDPPSSLLSPANTEAMMYLQNVARAFTTILRNHTVPVKFQIGEPWWWVMPDGRICLYDEAANTVLVNASVSIPDIYAPMDSAQRAMLDAAGVILAASTTALADAVRDEAGEAGAELMLLVYLPTVLDSRAHDLKRANTPLGWASPAFDILQIEDYDWVSAGNFTAQRRGLEEMQSRLGYSPAQQHYLSGFVLQPEDEAEWRHIADSAERAVARDVAATFIWALPQVARDGFLFFKLQGEGNDPMIAFDDVLFPFALGQNAQVSTAFSTRIAQSASGHERRNANWAEARQSYDVGEAVRSEQDLSDLTAFFRARRGAAKGFRFRDPFDFSSNAMTGVPNSVDQLLGQGDAVQTAFPLIKYYGDADEPQMRRITRPEVSSVRISVDAVEAFNWVLDPLGVIQFDDPPPVGTQIRAGFLFDVPVRFADDQLAINAVTFAAGEAPTVNLIELREAV